MAKLKSMTDEEFERQFTAANKVGEAAAKHAAISATYDRTANRIILDLKQGVTILISASLIDELGGATPEQLDEVKLLPSGLALHWESLDMDISLPGLLVDLIGTGPLLSEVGKRGRGKTSSAKAAAARSNGMKGGRPRKEANA